jgi:hypothetical protein
VDVIFDDMGTGCVAGDCERDLPVGQRGLGLGVVPRGWLRASECLDIGALWLRILATGAILE